LTALSYFLSRQSCETARKVGSIDLLELERSSLAIEGDVIDSSSLIERLLP